MLPTLILVAISGNPAALMFGRDVTYAAAFTLIAAYWFAYRPRTPKSAFPLPIGIAFIALAHTVSFGSLSTKADIGFLIVTCTGILFAHCVNTFHLQFVRLMAYLSAISLAFHIPKTIGIPIQHYLSAIRIPIENSQIFHIGLHNFHQVTEPRNSGFFWEPGAFAGYLLMALLLSIRYREVGAISRSHQFWIIAAILSTQSTMGYVTMILVYFLQILRENKYDIGRKILYLSISSAIGFTTIYVAATQFDFLGEKIASQIEATEMKSGQFQINRFGNLLYDIDSIVERPLLGWSANPETRFSINPDLEEHIGGQGSALTGYLVRYGIIGWLLLFYLLFKSFRSFWRSAPLAALSICTIALTFIGEQFTNFPLIYTLLLLPRSLDSAQLISTTFKRDDK